MEKELWKGNEAIAEAAIRAGCDCFFGYPITPQSEVPEYMSAHLPKAGGVFVQAESEVAAINMVYGAAGAGMRAMTSSSSPGISLKQEGISYMAGAELPCVIVNCMRGGPGLGTIQPGQGDYYQATRGGGNGDYRTVVLSPSNVQEAVDFVQEAFDIADQYRNPVMVVMDGLIGQMMEPIEWRPVPKRDLPPKDWATTGRKDRDHNNIINSLYMDPEECDRHNDHLAEKYALMEKNEVRWSETECEDAEIVITAYGTPARIALTALETLRAEGLKIVHLGDLGCRLTDEQAERIRGCDAIMAPAGGILTIEPYAAYELCVASGARVVLPMHYGGGGRGNRRLRPVDEFASLFGEGLVRRYETDRLELTAETPAQVAILTPPELHGRA